MRNILCYGDSNTWGYDPLWQARGKVYWRHPWEDRWTGVVQRLLGDDFRVIEEGFGGRTLGVDDPVAPFRNGRTVFPMLLESHQPLALVVILLGTNDTKAYLARTAEQIAADAGKLIEIARSSGTGWQGGAPDVLLLCPPAHHERVRLGVFDGEFDQSSIDRQQALAPMFQKTAQEYGAFFLDPQVKACEADGIHLDRQAHALLGARAADAIREILCAG